jgi:hypothetical protein
MEKNNVMNGFILFKDTVCNFDEIKKNLKSDWNIEMNGEIKEEATVFNVGNTMVALSFIPAPVPERQKLMLKIISSGKMELRKLLNTKHR